MALDHRTLIKVMYCSSISGTNYQLTKLTWADLIYRAVMPSPQMVMMCIVRLVTFGFWSYHGEFQNSLTELIGNHNVHWSTQSALCVLRITHLMARRPLLTVTCNPPLGLSALNMWWEDSERLSTVFICIMSVARGAPIQRLNDKNWLSNNLQPAPIDFKHRPDRIPFKRLYWWYRCRLYCHHILDVFWIVLDQFFADLLIQISYLALLAWKCLNC